VLVWLSVWSEVQTCTWPSWCYCHSLSLASVKSRLVLPFWYRLTWVVLEKGPLNGCVCVNGTRQIISTEQVIHLSDIHLGRSDCTCLIVIYTLNAYQRNYFPNSVLSANNNSYRRYITPFTTVLCCQYPLWHITEVLQYYYHLYSNSHFLSESGLNGSQISGKHNEIPWSWKLMATSKEEKL